MPQAMKMQLANEGAGQQLRCWAAAAWSGAGDAPTKSGDGKTCFVLICNADLLPSFER